MYLLQRPVKTPSLLLWIRHFDAVARREQLELLHRDLLLAPEVPSNEILKLAICKLKATALNQVLEVVDVHFLGGLVLDAEEEALQELVVLVLVRELVAVLSVESSHELTELFLAHLVPFFIIRIGILLQILHQWIVETLFGSLVLWVIVRIGPRQEILDKECNAEFGPLALNWHVVVSAKVEQQGAEDLYWRYVLV